MLLLKAPMMESDMSATLGIGPRPLTGIGGWLALLAFGVTLAPLFIFGSLITYYSSPDITAALTTIPTAMILEAILNVALFGMSFFVVFSFYRKKKNFPNIYMLFMAFAFLIYPLNALIVAVSLWNLGYSFGSVFAEVLSEQAAIKSMIQTVFGGIVWSLYLIRSRRVANTFIH